MAYGNSKIRDRMMEEEKTLLQGKLAEYEERLDRFRDSHKEQISKLNDQMDRKEERISLLMNENTSLSQAVQQLQLQNEKYKNKVSILEKQLLESEESVKEFKKMFESANK